MQHIGMTGTRNGMTPEQYEQFEELISSDIFAAGDVALHHGDCVGADSDAHDIVIKYKLATEVHPPIKDEVRAHKVGDVIHEPKGYFERNRDIVDSSEVVFGFPVAMFETPKGGTWYTINYAKKTNTSLIIIWPDGSIEAFSEE